MIYRDLYSYPQLLRFITLFHFFSFSMLSYCLCMLSEFAKVFERKIWRVQVAHLHNFKFWVGVFNCQQVLTKTSLVIFNVVVKKNRMWFSVDCILIDNDTGHHSSQDLLWNQWFIHACRHKQNFHGNLNGFLVTFSRILTFYFWSLSFRTLWRVLYSSQWHFFSLN